MVDKVNIYYRSKLNELTFGKSFHFSSRLWLWSQDEQMGEFLKSVRSEFCANGDMAKLDEIMTSVINTPVQDFGAKNAATERAPYFEKYQLLRPSLLALFRLLFTETVYGVNGRDLLAKHFSIDALDDMQEALLKDKQALSTLSTHAINFFYLYNRFYKRQEDGIPVEFLLSHAEQIDTTDNLNLLLYIYLITHCVIGESLFYKQHIPSDKSSVYINAMLQLEDSIEKRYDDVNMDNKFEMLVCFRILGIESRLESRIYQEAEGSLSTDGDFIIDRLNNNPQVDNIDFEKSEHRNVLFLLSHSEFRPTDDVIN